MNVLDIRDGTGWDVAERLRRRSVQRRLTGMYTMAATIAGRPNETITLRDGLVRGAERRESAPRAGMVIAGAAAVGVTGLALRKAGLPRIGGGMAALGAVVLGVALLGACTSGIPGIDSLVVGDEGGLPRPGSDKTKPAPGDWRPATGTLGGAREGVVRLEQGTAQGTGWVVAPGYVVTNDHVVDLMPNYVDVRDDQNTVRRAQLVAQDPLHDLALLKVDGLDDRPLPMDDVVERGEQAEITGYPGGTFAVSPGTATQMRNVTDSEGRRAAVYFEGYSAPGGSGSPIINGSGEVIATTFAAGSNTITSTGVESPIVLAADNADLRRLLDANGVAY